MPEEGHMSALTKIVSRVAGGAGRKPGAARPPRSSRTPGSSPKRKDAAVGGIVRRLMKR